LRTWQGGEKRATQKGRRINAGQMETRRGWSIGGFQRCQIFFDPTVVDAQEFVGTRCHVDQVGLTLGSFLVYELVDRVILGHGFQQAVHHKEQRPAQLWRAALGFALTGLVSARVNAGESGDRTSVDEPRHVPDFRHELRAEGIPYTVHLHNDRELRELGRQFQHLSLELFHGLGNSIEGINGLPDQPLGSYPVHSLRAKKMRQS